MQMYKHILAAVDLNEASHQIIAKALDLANHYRARLSIIHVIESIPTYNETFSEPPSLLLDTETQERLEKRAQKQFDKILSESNLPEIMPIVTLHGIAEHEILNYAKKHIVDFLLIGDHNRKGLLGAIGSTASALVRDAQCDIFVIKGRGGILANA